MYADRKIRETRALHVARLKSSHNFLASFTNTCLFQGDSTQGVVAELRRLRGFCARKGPAIAPFCGREEGGRGRRRSPFPAGVAIVACVISKNSTVSRTLIVR